MDMPKYNPVIVVDAVRAIRTYINSIDNVMYQIGDLHVVQRHLESLDGYDFQSMADRMHALSDELSRLVSDLEKTAPYKLLVKTRRGIPSR